MGRGALRVRSKNIDSCISFSEAIAKNVRLLSAKDESIQNCALVGDSANSVDFSSQHKNSLIRVFVRNFVKDGVRLYALVGPNLRWCWKMTESYE